MDDTKQMLLGIQGTLLGLVLVTFFEGVAPYPLFGLLFAGVGTAVVAETVI